MNTERYKSTRLIAHNNCHIAHVSVTYFFLNYKEVLIDEKIKQKQKM